MNCRTSAGDAHLGEPAVAAILEEGRSVAIATRMRTRDALHHLGCGRHLEKQYVRQVMAHIIMVHGSWSGGWMWDRVVPILTAAGHSAEAPTLIGAEPGGTNFPPQP